MSDISDNTPPIDVIFIQCPGHSGSTLLDLLIGGHDGITSGGEFRTWNKQLNNQCTCGAPSVRDCPFWQAVNSDIESYGYDIADIEQHGRDTDDFTDFNFRLFRAMQTQSGASVILDSSKRPKRLKQLLAHPDTFNVRIILLAREPLGVLASNRRKGLGLLKALRRIYLGHITQLRFTGKEAVFVNYARLAQAPEATLRQLMPALGLEFQADQLHPENHVYHNLGGNRMRKKPIQGISHDKRWKTELNMKEKILGRLYLIPACCLILIIRGLYTLNNKSKRDKA